ncbi:MAG: DUF362 domain-containing protein [Bacteroidetes bacterium]|nr:DUF362 domain-containing protein [Bacteroidota bacterium]
MKNNIGRREFIKKSIAAGIAAAAGSASLPQSLFGGLADPKIDISVVNGTNCFENTIKAVELLGGMGKFVAKGNKVGLLINSPWSKPGTYTNPDAAIAVLKMCLDAGAKEIYSIEDASSGYWKRSKYFGQFEKEIDKIKSGDSKKNVGILKSKLLKEAEISETLLNVDVFINIPIVKNHQGTSFTANLKNMMGACSRSTNRYFHQGSKKGSTFGYYNDVEFLSQCIADVNLIRQPNICIVDASEFVINNGPAGPGELKKANKIVAGKNCVAVDAYCAALLGLTPKEVLMIRYAHELGLGEIDIGKLSIKEI